MKHFNIVGEGTDLRTNTVWRDLVVTSDSRLFEGHFPDRPILPGVCLLDATLSLLRNLSDFGPEIMVSNLRIKSPVEPNDRIRLTLDISKEVISAVFTRDRIQIAQMKLTSSRASDFQNDTSIATESLQSAFVDRYLNDAVARLPHADPVHLVDNARLHEDGVLVATRYLDSAEPWFEPYGVTLRGPRIAPIAMIVESFLQSSALLLDKGVAMGPDGELPIFGGMRGLEICGSAYAGTSLRHTISTKIRAGNSLIVSGETYADGKLVCRYTNVALAIRSWDALPHMSQSAPDARAA